MATTLNKKLVGILTVAATVLMGAVGAALVYSLPGGDPARFHADAMAAEKEAKWELAAKNYMRAFKFDKSVQGGNPRWLVDAARCLYELGDLTLVRDYIKRARVLDPKHKEAQKLLTEAQFEVAKAFPSAVQWNDLREEAARMVELDPRLALGQAALGTASLRLSTEDASYKQVGEEALRRALELDPMDADSAIVLGEFMLANDRADEADRLVDEAVRQCENAKAAEPLSKLLIFRGQRFWRQGKDDEALAAFKQAQSAAPALVDPLLALAGYWSNKGESGLKECEKFLLQAKQADPTASDSYLRLAGLYSQQREPAKVVSILEEGLKAVERKLGFRHLRQNAARSTMYRQLYTAILFKSTQDPAGRDECMKLADEWLGKAETELGKDNLQVRFMRAQFYREQDKNMDAIKELESAKKAMGRQQGFEINLMLGDLYLQTGELGLAKESLEAALVAEPRAVGAVVMLARVLARQNQYDDALRTLESDSPPGMYAALQKYRDAILLRIECLQKLGRKDRIAEQRALLEKLGDLDPLAQARVSLAQGQSAEATKILKEAIAAAPKDPEPVLLLARLLAMEDNEDEARQVVAEAIQRIPGDRNLEAMAVVLNPTSDKEERKRLALAFIEREADPFNRAIQKFSYLSASQDLEAAQAALDEAEKLKPDSPIVIDRQFRLALMKQDWAKAERYCDRDAKLNNDFTNGRMLRGQLAFTRGDYEKAIGFYKEGLELYPSNSQGWTMLAEAYTASGRRDEARETLQRALKQNPTNGYANRMLAQMLIKDGDKVAAKKLLEAAKLELPDDPYVKSQLQLMAEEEDPAAGIAFREDLRKKDPQNTRNLLRLAKLYAQTHKPDLSDECLREAVKLKPDDVRTVFEAAEVYAKSLERPDEGETLLMGLLKGASDKEQKARVASLIARFYNDADLTDFAERYYLLAASLNPTVQVTLGVGEFYAGLNQPNDALDWFQKARDLAKESPEMLPSIELKVIQALILLRDKKRVEEELTKFLAKYPDNEQGYLLRGLFYVQMGDLRQAEVAFREQLERQPDAAMAHWQLGTVYAMRNRWQSAIEELQKAKTFKPDGFRYEHRISLGRALIGVGRVDEGMSELQGIVKESPDTQSAAMVLVDQLLRCEPPRISEAETLVHAYIQRFPADPKWPLKLSAVATVAGDQDKVIDGYRRAVEVSGFASAPVMSLLRAYQSAKRFDEVREFVLKKLPETRRRRLPMVVAILGECMAEQGDLDGAEQQFLSALNLARDDFDAFRYISMAMWRCLGSERALARNRADAQAEPNNVEPKKVMMFLLHGNKSYEEALSVGDEIVKNADRDDDIIFGLNGQAIILTTLGRFEEAKSKYENTLKLDPTNGMALNNMAYLLADKLKRPQEALPYSEKAEELAPRDANALDTLGWVYAELGRLSDAEGTLLRALDVDGKNYAALYHLGLVYQRLGEKQDARARFEAAARAAAAAGDTTYKSLAEEAAKGLSGSP